MTMRDMAIGIVAHEAERKGIEMSEAEIRRKAKSLHDLYCKGLGQKAGLQRHYEREMARM